MDKRMRLIIIICIILSALSFMGGMIYKYESVLNIVEFDPEKDKYTYDFIMPIDLETASIWLEWAIGFHQYYIDICIDRAEAREGRQLEIHYARQDMYKKIKVLFLEFEEEYQNKDEVE